MQRSSERGKAYFSTRRQRQPCVLRPQVLKRAHKLAEGGTPVVGKGTLDLKLDTLNNTVRMDRLLVPLKND